MTDAELRAMEVRKVREVFERKTDEELRAIRTTLHAFVDAISAELNGRRLERKRKIK